jgi:hypothetical protein
MAVRQFRAMEYLWAAIAIFTLAAGSKVFWYEGFARAYPLFIFCAVATGMYFFRRFYFKKQKRENTDL